MKHFFLRSFLCVAFALVVGTTEAWAPLPAAVRPSSLSSLSSFHRRTSLAASVDSRTKQEKKQPETTPPSVEDTTEKYGLEVGLFESLKQKDGGESAKSLLKRYGIAYLATSIPLALISFAICYVLVDSGVDVASLLAKIGIETSTGGVGEKAGTLALAYAAHKAASPIRFPPTVVLTPVVAKLIGKEPVAEDEQQAGDKS